MNTGTFIFYQLKLRGIPLKWKTRIDSWIPNQSFVDRQIQGPYSQWIHLHEFFPCLGGTLMLDTVDYRVPGGILGDLITEIWVKKDLEKIFDFRKEQTDKFFHG